jgi:hypothetical protein
MKQKLTFCLSALFILAQVSVGKTISKQSILQNLHAGHTKPSTTAKATSIFTPQKETNYYWDLTNNVWTISDTTYYTYDGKAHVMSRLQKDQTGANVMLTTYTYNANGLQTDLLMQSWDNTTNTWVNMQKNTKNYDIHSNITLEQSEFWDNTINAWSIVSSAKHAYTYNAAGLPSSKTNSYWDPTSATFIVSDRSINMTYNTANLILSEQMDYFDGTTNTWTPYTLDNYTYNNQNVLTTMLESSYSFPSGWEPVYRAANLVWYSWNGNLDNSLIQSYYVDDYDYNTSSWVWGIRGNVTYGVNNSSTEIQESYASGSWVNYSKGISNYDAQNNQTLSENYSWDATTNTWTFGGGLKYLYQYNGQGAMLEKIMQYYDSFNTFAYVNSNKSVYEDILEFNWATNIHEATAMNALLSPNPCHDRINIQLKNKAALQIFDLQGKLMYNNNCQQAEVNCSDWANGVYFISVIDPTQGTLTKKFIKD